MDEGGLFRDSSDACGFTGFLDQRRVELDAQAAKAKPGALNVGTINVGSTQNLAAQLFKSTAGVDVTIDGSPVEPWTFGEYDAEVSATARRLRRDGAPTSPPRDPTGRG